MSATMTAGELVGRFRAQRDRYSAEAFEAIARAMQAAADPKHPVRGDVPWDQLERVEAMALGVFLLDADLRLSVGSETRDVVANARTELESVRAELKQAKAEIASLTAEVSELKESKRRLREALDRAKGR